MPNIIVKLPAGVLNEIEKRRLMNGLTDAAAVAEQIPDDPKNRFLCWVLIEEVPNGGWSCGGVEVTSRLIPVVVVIYLPAGVLVQSTRELYVQLVDQACKAVTPDGGLSKVVTSVILQEVNDGSWGAGGHVWRLPDFAARAGYLHLQNLVK